METRTFKVTLTEDELSTYKGTCVLFFRVGDEVKKKFVWNITYKEFKKLDDRVDRQAKMIATDDLLSSLSDDLDLSDIDLEAITGFDAKWGPEQDQDYILSSARGCKDYNCPSPCIEKTSCTCAFGPCV